MAKDSFFNKIKEYGGLGFIVLSALVAGAISYGTSTATAASKLDQNTQAIVQHDIRINKLEENQIDTGKAIVQIQQHIDDLWHDAGHKD